MKKPEWISLINSWELIPSQIPESFPPDLRVFFEFYLKRDSAFDVITLERGQHFFEQKGDLYLAMLGFYSLPYCYAFADGAEVLARSRRIIESIGERLGETGIFVMEIFRPGAFIKDKSAFLICAKVRLIHAFSRFFILHYSKDWQETFGKPVNQEDMLGTNLAFSQIVIRGLLKLGVAVNEKEHSEILAYWRWIGELMGIEVGFWPETSKEAFELDKLIRRRHLRSSDAGKKLVSALMDYYKINIPDPLVNAQIQDILCFFLGKEVSKTLGLIQQRTIQGDLLGLIFAFSGWKNSGGKKSYQTLRQSFEKQQLDRFGRQLQIRLPEMKHQ